MTVGKVGLAPALVRRPEAGGGKPAFRTVKGLPELLRLGRIKDKRTK